ncbi:MAG: tail fiber domain-containing protein [Bacteroides sp.]|nr:tail fiber domain-containing protein [Bacteroides sp.]
MKTPILFALALVWGTGILAQELVREDENDKTAKAVPTTIDFQGRLHLENGNPVSATLDMTFSLYDVPSGGVALWTETQTVQVSEGLFQVKLGEINPLHIDHFAGSPGRWLGMQIGTEPEMSPRTQFSSVGYALQAPEGDPTWVGDPIPSEPVGRTGNVGIGTENPQAKLEVAEGDALINDLTIGKGGGGHLENTALGNSALSLNESGLYNTAMGNASLLNNLSGIKNSAFGYHALFSNTSGHDNTAIGTQALSSNSTGKKNTATGFNSLSNNTSGENNVATGEGALYSNTIGNNNTALGQYALPNNIGGHGNTSVGQHTMAFNSSGSYNTALGNYALNNNTTAYANVAIGAKALFQNTDRSNLVAVGDSALYNNGLGASALHHGLGNTAIGSKSLFSNTIGDENTACGNFSMYYNQDGVNNSALGGYALYNNLSGNNNTAMGYEALMVNASGSGNTAIGGGSLSHNKSDSNTAIGYHSGNAGIITQFLNNVNNTFIGANTGYSDGNIANSTALGANVMLTHSNTVILGNNANIGIGTTTPEGMLEIKGNSVDNFPHVFLTETDGFSRISFRTLLAPEKHWVIAATTQESNSLSQYHINFNNGIEGKNMFSIYGDSRLYLHGEVGITGGLNVSGEIGIGGMVGIGTTAPNRLLHVFGEANPRILVESPAQAPELNLKRGSTLHSMYVNGNQDLVFSCTSDRMVITDNGMVGIGTINPTRPLHIFGEANPRILVESPAQAPELNLKRGSTVHALYVNGNDDLVFYCLGDRMSLTNDGNVGIGTTAPNYKLDVRGTIGNSTTLYHSDRRWKTRIQPIPYGLNALIQLQGVSYVWKQEEFPQMGFEEGIQFGFIAQDLEQVIPELVKTDAEGYKSIDYVKLLPVMAEAIKELKAENDRLRAENDTLKNNDQQLNARLERLEKALESLSER